MIASATTWEGNFQCIDGLIPQQPPCSQPGTNRFEYVVLGLLFSKRKLYVGRCGNCWELIKNINSGTF